MTAPESHSPPVYAVAAGAVVHAHAGSTLEPALLLHTFLPPGVEDVLRDETPRVDVSSDGPGATTVTVRVLAGSTSLSWSVPIGPVVAALPGQPGDDGRMVLLALVDREPTPSFWADPVDCEQLAAELQLPVADVERGAARPAHPVAGRRPRAAAARRRPRPGRRPLPRADARDGGARPLPRRPGRRDRDDRPGARAVARSRGVQRRARRPAVRRPGRGARDDRRRAPASRCSAAPDRSRPRRCASSPSCRWCWPRRPPSRAPSGRWSSCWPRRSATRRCARPSACWAGWPAPASARSCPTTRCCGGSAWSTTRRWPGCPGCGSTWRPRWPRATAAATRASRRTSPYGPAARAARAWSG